MCAQGRQPLGRVPLCAPVAGHPRHFVTRVFRD